jgi:formylglycine-generating enzyme required for sulfatase activity
MRKSIGIRSSVLAFGFLVLSATTFAGPGGEIQHLNSSPISAEKALIPNGTISIRGVDHKIDPFFIDAVEVTNRQFSAFVADTGYVTVAERELEMGAASGSAVFRAPSNRSDYWWVFDATANWRQPDGAGDHGIQQNDEPVVHIAYEDSVTYADWVGGRLPSEAEWEFASRGTDERQRYKNKLGQNAENANVWNGFFPLQDEGTDGYRGIAPVGQYAANSFGLFDMNGNVWEWVARDPQRDEAGFGLLAGGSFLCSDNFCRNARHGGRQVQELDFSASHIGFRVAYDVEKLD